MKLNMYSSNAFFNFNGHNIVLPDINIDFSGITLIKGAIGTGKTLFLRCLAGVDRPHNGEICLYFNKKPVKAYFLHSQPEYNFVATDLIDELVLAGIKETSFFDEWLGRGITKLSGGELKRISLLIALMSGYRAIVLDEPLDMLDDKQSFLMMQTIYKYSRNISIILATHDKYFDSYADYTVELCKPSGCATYSISGVSFPDLKDSSHEIYLTVNNFYINVGELETKLLNFEVRPKEISCLMGGNGSGKTLFIKALAGIGMHKYSGEIDWHISRDKRGICLQFPEQLIYCATILEEVVSVAGANYAQSVINLLGWQQKSDCSPHILSDGEKRLLFIVSLLLSKTVCIFDEPFAGLDRDTSMFIAELFKKAVMSGKSIFYTANRFIDTFIADRNKIYCID